VSQSWWPVSPQSVAADGRHGRGGSVHPVAEGAVCPLVHRPSGHPMRGGPALGAHARHEQARDDARKGTSMKALVVVESVFGNTRQIADAVAAGLARHVDVAVVDVAVVADTVEDVDLLVVGGPTHAFGMTRMQTRRAAADQSGGAVSADPVGLREWLLTMRGTPRAVATFDTRMDAFRLPGSAAAGAARKLRRRGLRMLDRPTTFRVVGTQGPLRPGELERAQEWGADLAARLVAQPAGGTPR